MSSAAAGGPRRARCLAPQGPSRDKSSSQWGLRAEGPWEIGARGMHHLGNIGRRPRALLPMICSCHSARVLMNLIKYRRRQKTGIALQADSRLRHHRVPEETRTSLCGAV